MRPTPSSIFRLGTSALVVLTLSSCGSETTTPMSPDVAPQFAKEKAQPAGGDLVSLVEAANVALADQGLQIASAEWMGADQAGNTVYFNNRGNKQLGVDFVPGDPRRGGRTDITYVQDGFDAATTSGLSVAQTIGAIDAAMTTWNSQQCSNLPLTNLGASNDDLGFVQFLLGFGGFPGFIADITHGGFLPGSFFDAVAPGGSNFILGVTFTFVWTGPDLDNNGKADTAFREIYYNDAFTWGIDGGIDVETVALHEAGHGLSQGHFGKAFSNKGGFHFAPRAVMNAGYSGVQQTLAGTDNAGHCSNWGSWPNN